MSEVAGIVVDKTKHADSAFYVVKKIVNYVLNLGDELKYVRLDKYSGQLDSSTNVYEPLRSAVLLVDDRYVGVVGELRNDVRQRFKLPEFVAGFSLMLGGLLPYIDRDIEYTPVSKYQGTSRDITYQVSNEVDYADVYNFTRRVLVDKLPDRIVAEVSPRDIYATGDGKRNITLHIDFHDLTKTIDAKLVGKVMDRLAKQSNNELNAHVI